jgi:signal recognition particle receptor subunit beta
MVSINYAFKEICCKIVFYGPGLSGKTTNLQYVHKKMPSPTRGELISLATDQDRTLYFDFLPVDIGKINGFSVKFQLYTVPGQVYYNATRKLVLRGVDGLVFVADSQRFKMDENIESYQNLGENLSEYRYDMAKLPLVLQYNKRDLPDIFSVDELENVLNPEGLPYFEAVATQGAGVFDTLRCISKLVLDLAKGKKVVPERGVPVEELVMAESKPAQPERVAGSDVLRVPASASPVPEESDVSGMKESQAVGQEEMAAVSEGGLGSAPSPGCPSGQTGEQTPSFGEVLSAEHQREPETPLPEKTEEPEAEEEKMVSGELIHAQQEKEVKSAEPLPKVEETPTIISWSAARQKEKSEPKRFFLWRFFEKLVNR